VKSPAQKREKRKPQLISEDISEEKRKRLHHFLFHCFEKSFHFNAVPIGEELQGQL
jgi:hypothetical protein